MKRLLLTITIVLCTQIISAQWLRTGNDIDGAVAFDYSGDTNSLAISGDGSVIAIGAPDNDANGSSSGQVRIYKNINNVWTQIGGDIEGAGRDDRLGIGIDLSKNGNIIAIGESGNNNIKVFENINNTWIQKGNNTSDVSAGQGIGFDVAINADGSRLATTIANTIILYYFMNNQWTIGKLIELSGTRNSLANASVAFNDAGDVLVIGNRQYNGNNDGTEDGRVLVYQEINNVWSQKGTSIISNNNNNSYFGSSVDISGDGNIITLGSPHTEVDGFEQGGFVRTYKFENNDWQQIGSDIKGYANQINFGRSVSLNNAGTILAIGADGRGNSGTGRGIARIYEFKNNDWVQINATIVGEASKDAFGSSITLSDSGSVVAIGGSDNDGNGSNAGHVRVFKNDGIVNNYTSIPDTNFEQHLIDQNIDSENTLDGKVLTSDIENLKSLDVSNKSISNLQGIEGFIALTSLKANNNAISLIDISNNILLDSLMIHQNQLTTIDVTKNVNLKTINLDGNQLTTLNVAQNKELVLLSTHSNSLPSIDLKENTKLEYLLCSANQLTTLDLKNNILLKELNCSLNQLSALDVSLNSNLISLNCERNSIIYLDVSANKNLTKIICNDNALIGLNMQNGNNNQVLNENFSAFANPNLVCILVEDKNYSDNNWSQIDMQTEFSTMCTEYITIPDANFEAYLESINVGNGIVGDNLANKDLIEVLTSLNIASKNINNTSGIEYFTNLTFLDISDNGLNQIDLSKNILLETFISDFNQFTNFNFAQNTKLKAIEARNNLISTLEVSNLVDLEILELESNQIVALDITLNTKISTLDVKNNQLENLDVSNQPQLVVFEANNNLLRFINLKNTANPTISTLETTNNLNLTCIEVLNLDYFDTISPSIDAQTKFYENCPSTTAIPDANFEAYLESINLGNGVVDDGLVFTEAIEIISDLNIEAKSILDITGIQDFTSLVELNAKNNAINQVDLSKNILLEIINLENNKLTTIDFSNNRSLKNINLGDNQLTDLDVYLLENLESLQCYKNQLTSINLISNKKLQLFVANENQLKQVDIRVNEALVWLDVDDNALESLTLKNGNNTKIAQFSATGNPNLTCIEVDDVSFSETNWTAKDATATFSGDCAPANDDCSFAIPLIFGQETPGDINNGTFTNATDCVAGTIIADVWYSITIPETGEFSIQGAGLGGLLKFVVYESCASSSAVSCGVTISLTNLNPGDVYYLKVWMEESSTSNKSSNLETGTFTITANESSVLSVDDFTRENIDLVVFPNPAKSNISVLLSNSANLQKIDIYSILGDKIISQKNLNQVKTTIDVSHLSSGIYFIRAKVDDKIMTKKLIIR